MRIDSAAIICGLFIGIFATPLAWAATPKRPLVFVPGILGSNLAHGQEIVWGEGDSLLNLSKLNLKPAEGTSLDLEPAGIVETVPLLFGLIKLDQYSDFIKFLETLGYERNSNLFIFDYDWRKSNFSTARNLSKFVQNHLGPGDPYDLLVHSMGGLVARIFLHEGLPGATSVHTLIEMGVPHYGSVDMVATLQEGWGTPGNLMAGGLFNSIENIREILLSFPSIYELFPRYPRCCAYGNLGDRYNIEIEEPWSVSLWTNELRWVIDVSRWDNLKNIVQSGFRSADALQVVMEATEANMPYVTRHFSFEGRKIKTHETVYYNKSSKRITYRGSENGDGTVHRSSAMSKHARPSYMGLRQHGTMFNDRALRIVLSEILSSESLEIQPVDDERDQISGKDIKSFEFEVNPPVLAQGGSVGVTLGVEATSGNWGQATVDVQVRFAQAIDPSIGSVVKLSRSETADEAAAGILRFRGDSPSFVHDGMYRVTFIVNGVERLNDFIEVLPAEVAIRDGMPQPEGR